MIVLGHAGSLRLVNYDHDIWPDLRQAVSFFFVLSGFILSHAYPALDWRRELRGFFAARWSRLYPTYVLTAIGAILLVSPVTDSGSAVRTTVNLLMLQAWIPVAQWYYSVNNVAWSISVEVAFYLLFPFVLPFARWKPFAMIIAAIGLVVLIVSTSMLLSFPTGPTPATQISAQGWLYNFPLSRVPEFLLGMAAYQLAIRYSGHMSRWTIGQATVIELFAVTGVYVAMWGVTYLSRGYLAIHAPHLGVWAIGSGPAPAFAVLLVVLVCQKGAVSKILQWPILVYLGEISFALYMVHYVILIWLNAHYREAMNDKPTIWYAILWISSLGSASLIHHFVEQPWRKPLQRLLAEEAMFSNRRVKSAEGR